MTDEIPDADERAGRAGDEPDRREPDRIDRRKVRRGGRRATDLLGKLASFAYRLLTEPPR